MKEFHSEFADVKYIEKDNIVLLTWKKRAVLDDYRNPTTFALSMLRDNKGSNFVIDARNGFEDDKRDVEWGFSFLLPEMSKTTCNYVVFIMNDYKHNDIEEEMDMWTFEFSKYFKVRKCSDYQNAVMAIIQELPC